jgi:hypothetical protein
MFVFILSVDGKPRELKDLVACGLIPPNAYVEPDGRVRWSWETPPHTNLQDAVDEIVCRIGPHLEGFRKCVKRGARVSVLVQQDSEPLTPERDRLLRFGPEAMQIIAAATQMMIIVASDPIENLRVLGELRDAGRITAEQFELERDELIQLLRRI